MRYFEREIDRYLSEWADETGRKPLLLRGARQVGKSSSVRHIGERFDTFVEINFEKEPEYKQVFQGNLVIERILSQLEAISGRIIEPGKTLLFLDEIQSCPEAIMSLRFFKEDMPNLHVIAAGSLLEFALADLPTFGVGRIQSMFMYPMSFDEFLKANGATSLLKLRNQASFTEPLLDVLHNKLVEYLRTFLIIGGMPDVVSAWVEHHNYLKCQAIQDSLILSFEDDFAKYRKKVAPEFLRKVFQSVAMQSARKFVYSEVGEYRSEEVKRALELLSMAGICIPVYKTSANGLPLGAESVNGARKMMVFDTGLLLRLLHLSAGDITDLISLILNGDDMELVNKGAVAEVFVGLELLRYGSPACRGSEYYWSREAKNSIAEVDYVIPLRGQVTPIEVKSGVKGGMKSLWIFMREKKLSHGIRTSLENFGRFEYVDAEANGAMREVSVCPLYAISRLLVGD